VSLNFIFFSVFLDDITGQLIAMIILAIAGAESAIGLALVVTLYRLNGSILLKDFKHIKC